MAIFRKVFFLSIFFFAFFSSCTTYRANMLLLRVTTDEQKADLLFNNGLETYTQKVLKEGDLRAIPTVRTRFQDALKLYPDHAKSQRYLADLASYEEKQFTTNLAIAKAHAARTKRTEAQDYGLLLALQKIEDLKKTTAETNALKADTKDLRISVIKNRSTQLTELEEKLKNEPDNQGLLKQLMTNQRLARELAAIDPKNNTAKRVLSDSTVRIAKINDEIVVSKTTTPSRTTTRAPVRATTSKPDYDADIQSIVASIDSALKTKNVGSAQQIVLSKKPLLSNKENIAKLDAKQTEISSAAQELYQEAVLMYNEEDYESARQLFTSVLAYDSEYAQAKAYLDRTNTKIRALSGN